MTTQFFFRNRPIHNKHGTNTFVVLFVTFALSTFFANWKVLYFKSSKLSQIATIADFLLFFRDAKNVDLFLERRKMRKLPYSQEREAEEEKVARELSNEDREGIPQTFFIYWYITNFESALIANDSLHFSDIIYLN